MKPFAFLRWWREPTEPVAAPPPAKPLALVPPPAAQPARDTSARWISYEDLGRLLGISAAAAYGRADKLGLERRRASSRRRKRHSSGHFEVRITDTVLAQLQAIQTRRRAKTDAAPAEVPDVLVAADAFVGVTEPPAPVAPVAPVAPAKSKRGGRRPGAGRKRKQPLAMAEPADAGADQISLDEVVTQGKVMIAEGRRIYRSANALVNRLPAGMRARARREIYQ